MIMLKNFKLQTTTTIKTTTLLLLHFPSIFLILYSVIAFEFEWMMNLRSCVYILLYIEYL